LPNLVIPKIKSVEIEENYERFVAEPLEKGFGTTLGNALRRILLGYLPGAAVTRVRIERIHHEFSTIPHVKEDTTEFLLNVKEIRLRSLSGQPAKLILEAAGNGQVQAADIKPSVDFEIVNPDLHLATLDSPEAKLYAELDVDIGIGYKEAESSDNLPIGTIPIDSIFTPIQKVNFAVELIHTGAEIGRESLTLDIWTDGTIPPVDALSQSADILINQLSPFADYAEFSQIEIEKKAFRMSIPDEKYNMSVEQLDFSVRTLNALRRANIPTVGELVSTEEKDLLRLRNFGQKSLQEVRERLEGIELSLASKIQEIPTEEKLMEEEELEEEKPATPEPEADLTPETGAEEEAPPATEAETDQDEAAEE